jgi:hypothetical protein
VGRDVGPRRGRTKAHDETDEAQVRTERRPVTSRRLLRRCAFLLAGGIVVAGLRAAAPSPAAALPRLEAETAHGALKIAGRASTRRFTVFVALEQADRVAVVNGPPWHVVHRVRVPAGPHNLIASPNDNYVAVTSPPAGAVSIFDARSGRLIRSVRVGGYPHDVVFGAASRALWVTAGARRAARRAGDSEREAASQRPDRRRASRPRSRPASEPALGDDRRLRARQTAAGEQRSADRAARPRRCATRRRRRPQRAVGLVQQLLLRRADRRLDALASADRTTRRRSRATPLHLRARSPLGERQPRRHARPHRSGGRPGSRPHRGRPGAAPRDDRGRPGAGRRPRQRPNRDRLGPRQAARLPRRRGWAARNRGRARGVTESTRASKG